MTFCSVWFIATSYLAVLPDMLDSRSYSIFARVSNLLSRLPCTNRLTGFIAHGLHLSREKRV
jgi:hypothetical protein